MFEPEKIEDQEWSQMEKESYGVEFDGYIIKIYKEKNQNAKKNTT